MRVRSFIRSYARFFVRSFESSLTVKAELHLRARSFHKLPNDSLLHIIICV